jgi:hypothetical protein
MPQALALQRFSGADGRSPHLLERGVQVEVAREARSSLILRYTLRGCTSDLLIPPALAVPCRCDDLWQHTCFEAFLAIPGDEPYWELNLSPGGAWNLYRLAGYRRELRPESRCQAVPLRWWADAGQARLEATLELPPELAAADTLELGLTAVLERRDGALEYWALSHPGPEADFHRRDGFSLRLVAEDHDA